jgi:hypothetical protein
MSRDCIGSITNYISKALLIFVVGWGTGVHWNKLKD